MPIYTYRGRNVRTNESLSGERFSNSAQALAAVLRREQIAPIAIQEKKAAGFNFSFRKKVSQSEVAIFTRQFSVMLDAGLPLVQALDAIAQQHPNKDFKAVLEQIRSDVESGTTLSAAMARHPKVFDTLYHQHDCSRRDRRHPGYHSAAVVLLHRKNCKTQASACVLR